MKDTILKPNKTKKVTPKVTAKVTKISSILDFSNKAKKSSIKLRKTFEKGIYQKRTQLSILDRYKKRLDQIEKEDERATKRKSKRKVKLPQIKKFAGNFFSPGSSDDPLKAIGALAAFKAATRASSGDLSGAIPPALIAGLMFGAPLIGGAAGSLLNRNRKIPRGFDVTGRRVSPRSRERYRRRFGDKNFKNRFGKDELRRSKNKSPVKNIGRGSRVAKSFGKFGAAIVPGLGAVVGAADATLRAQSGDVTGSAIAGVSASLDAAAAASAATGIGLPVAGLLSIGSFALDLVNLSRDLFGFSEREEEKNKKLEKENKTPEDRLKEQTEKQKSIVESLKLDKNKLTFGKTLESYSKAIEKFEEFSKQFSYKISPDPEKGINYPNVRRLNSTEAYRGPISGETFFPLPGGQEGQQSNQQFGASRGTRSHKGLDMVKFTGDLSAPVVAFKTGKVIVSETNGYNGYVILSHGEGLQTMYYHITPSVNVGDIVYGGQQLGTLYPVGQNTHLHFEVIENGTNVDPKQFGTGKNKITTPLSKERAKKISEKKEKPEEKPEESSINEFKIDGKKFYKGSDNRYYKESQGDKVVLTEEEFNESKEKYMRMNKNKQRSVSTLPRGRNIEQYPSYSPSTMQNQVIPVSIPIPNQQPKMMIQNSSQPLVIGGLTEEEVLNSYYKRVLLNALV